MAIFPCNRGMHRYGPRQQTAYATLLEGSHPETRRARLCPHHFDELEELCGDMMSPADEGLQSSLVCEICERAKTHSIFVTLYRDGSEPSYWARDVCAEHMGVCLEALGWAEFSPRAG